VFPLGDFCTEDLQPYKADRSPTSVARLWDNVYRMTLHYAHCGSDRTILGSQYALGAKLEVIEPSVPSWLTDSEETKTAPPPVQGPSKAWPFPSGLDPHMYPDSHFWHRADAFTGLDSALTELTTQLPELKFPDDSRVLVAHLDTGYPSEQSDNVDLPLDTYRPLPGYPMPPNFKPEISADCYEPYLRGETASDDYIPCDTGGGNGTDVSNRDPRVSGTSWFLTNMWHGAGTLSILAGGYVDNPSDRCDVASVPHWGADPCAAVFEVRVSQSFVHFNEETLAIGIQYAIDNKADVISLSHGGLPAAVLEEQVNLAYNAGVPIFAASGDFLGGWFLSTPKTTVFPARYNQVLNVTGADADYLSSGKHCFILGCIWHFWGGNGFWSNAFSWLVGTNYGPTDLMREHSIAAFTPNITYYEAAPGARGMADDEMGTSAAVPQAAAAAALWLQFHRHEIEADTSDGEPAAPSGSGAWRTWRKSESVYRALIGAPAPGDRPTGQDVAQPESYKQDYYGAGILNARRPLDQPYNSPSPCDQRPPSHADTFWWLDALGSLTIFDIVDTNIPVSRAAGEAAAVQDALKTSLITELMQLSYRNRELQSFLSTLTGRLALRGADGCVIAHPNLSPITRNDWRRLAELISSDSYASQGIRHAADWMASH
jgi:hypothetical protein